MLGLLDAALGDLAVGRGPSAGGAGQGAGAGPRALGRPAVSRELAQVLRRAGRPGEARALEDDGPDDARADQEAPPFRLERAGDVWTMAHGDRIARVKDSRGMQMLARLAERPGEEIHVLALAGEGGSLVESHAGELLDDRARQAYRRRIAEIDAALERGPDEAAPPRAAAAASGRPWPTSSRAPPAWAAGRGWRARPPSAPASTSSGA